MRKTADLEVIDHLGGMFWSQRLDYFEFHHETLTDQQIHAK